MSDNNKQHSQENEFLNFVDAFKVVAQFNGISIDDLDVIDDYNDLLDDYEDDLLDERYGNPSPDYTLNFYNALEELHFQYVNEDSNSIWYMTNGERALTFKDDRLVDVRLAEHIENLVYFSAPIHVEDLLDEWEVNNIVDEETKKINEIILKIQELKDNALVQDLLYIIERYTE